MGFYTPTAASFSKQSLFSKIQTKKEQRMEEEKREQPSFREEREQQPAYEPEQHYEQPKKSQSSINIEDQRRQVLMDKVKDLTMKQSKQRIKTIEQRIHDKSYEGYTQAHDVMTTLHEQSPHRIHPSRHNTNLNKFVDKLSEVKREEHKVNSRVERHLNAAKLEGLEQMLREYNLLSRVGWKDQNMADFLDTLGRGIRAIGPNSTNSLDHTTQELYDTWKMHKLVDDLKYGLEPGVFYSPHYLAKTCRALSMMEYKNTEVVQLLVDKILLQLQRKDISPNLTVPIQQMMFGGGENTKQRYNIFEGYQDNKEFDKLLETFMKWRTEKYEGLSSDIQEFQKKVDVLPHEQRKEVMEVYNLMKSLINVTEENTQLQEEVALSLSAVRDQYNILINCWNSYEFIQKNDYIKYDLMELQELVVKGGLLHPDQALDIDTSMTLEFDEQMLKVSTIFSDILRDYYPELQSGQHLDIKNAVDHIKSQFIGEKFENKEMFKMNESHNDMNVYEIGDCLSALGELQQIYRRDVANNDFPHEYFKRKLYPDEYTKIVEKRKYDTVYGWCPLKKEYANHYQSIQEGIYKMVPHIKQLLLEEQQLQPAAYLQLLGGMAHTRVYDGSDILGKDLLQKLKESYAMQEMEEPKVIDCAYGFYGLGGHPEFNKNPEYLDLAERLGQSLAQCSNMEIYELDLKEKIKLLWGLCATKQFSNPKFKILVEEISMLPFENLTNELSYDEAKILKDIALSIQYESKPSPDEYHLYDPIYRLGRVSDTLKVAYLQNQTQHDPFYSRVKKGILQGIGDAGFQMEDVFEKQLETTPGIEQLMFYQPVCTFGYKGNKIALFLHTELGGCSTGSDGKYLTSGDWEFRYRIMEEANKDENMKCVSVHIPQVVDYNLPTLKADVRDNGYDLVQALKDHNLSESHIKTDDLYDIVLKLTKSENFQLYIENNIGSRDLVKFNQILQEIRNFISLNHMAQAKPNKIQRAQAFNELKHSLVTIISLYNELDATESENQILNPTQVFYSGFSKAAQQKGYVNFKDMLLKVKDQINESTPEVVEKEFIGKINKNWHGVACGLELPLTGAESKKNLAPEILNQSFMMSDDYFHYQDWKDDMIATYDSFNLLVRPSIQVADDSKYFFHNNGRMTPTGIFPDGKGVRKLIRSEVDSEILKRIKSGNQDQATMFEKDKYRSMIVEEFLRPKRALTDEVLFKTNLSNLKNGLKKEFSDMEIVETLTELDLVQNLLKQHLKPQKKSRPLFLNRDSNHFRQFRQNVFSSKDQFDPFTNYLIQEKARIDGPEKVKDDYDQKMEVAKQNSDYSEYKRLEDEKERVLDHIHTAKEFDEEDRLQTTLYNDRRVIFDPHVETAMTDQNNHRREEQAFEMDMSNEQYLSYRRRVAESNLIKTCIAKKLHDEVELTGDEKEYLHRWRENPDLIPAMPSYQSIGEMSGEDVYKLSALPGVHLDQFKDYSVNEVVLELSNFIDDNFIKDIEKNVHSSQLRDEWSLDRDIVHRNKELDIVLSKIEEDSWRTATKFDEKEEESIKKLFLYNHQTTHIGRHYHKKDVQNLDETLDFLSEHDDRINLFNQWMERKEYEMNRRFKAVPDHMNHTEKEQKHIERETFKHELNRMPYEVVLNGEVVKKNYDDLAPEDLHLYSEGLVRRLYMFNYDYPAFLTHLITHITEHPNISQTDRDLLETYSELFQIQKYDKPLKFGSDIDVTQKQQHVKQAAVPFMPDIVNKFIHI